MPILRCLATVVALSVIAVDVSAQTAAPIRYTIRFPAPQTNYLEVEAVVPTDGRAAVETLPWLHRQWSIAQLPVRHKTRNRHAVTP